MNPHPTSGQIAFFYAVCLCCSAATTGSAFADNLPAVEIITTQPQVQWRVDIPQSHPVTHRQAAMATLPDGVRGSDLAQAPDGSIYLLCNTYTVHDNEQPNRDILLVKYSPTGERIWHRQLAGEYADIGWCIDTDDASNVYIAGITGQVVDARTNTSAQFAFVASYTSSGRRRWAHIEEGFTDKDGEGHAYAIYHDMTIDGDALYLTGQIAGLVHRRGTTDSEHSDALVSRFRLNGRKVWSHQYAGDSRFNSRAGLGIAAGGGRLYIAGVDWYRHNGRAQGPEHADNFLMCLDNDGDFGWQQVFGTVPNPHLPGMAGTRGLNEGATSVAIDSTGHVYICGFSNGDLGAQPKPADWDFPTHPYVAKYSPHGQQHWLHELVGPFNRTLPHQLHLDADDRVWVIGNARWQNSSKPERILVMQYNTQGELRHLLCHDQEESYTGDTILYDSEQNQLVLAGRFTKTPAPDAGNPPGAEHPHFFLMRIAPLDAADNPVP